MAVALVGQATAEATTNVSTLAVTRSTSGGNLLVLCAAIASSGSTITSIADTAGNTWTNLVKANTAGQNNRVEIWVAANAAAVTSVTATFGSTLRASLNLSEWSGADSAATQDAERGKEEPDGVHDAILAP